MTILESDLIPYHAVHAIGAGSVLILAPHADDEVLGCAGAIAAHRAAGERVQVIVLTDGAAYVDITQRSAWIAQRQAESRAAAMILDYTELEFWNYPDRGLVYDQALVTRITTAVTQTQSRWVYAPSLYELHPDHRALALAALAVMQRLNSAITLVLYEVSAPLNPNRLLDITRFAALKTRAIACFTSQLAMQDYRRQVLALNAFRTYTLPRTTKLAEAYLVVDPMVTPGTRWDPYLPAAIQNPDISDLKVQLNQKTVELTNLRRSRVCRWWQRLRAGGQHK